MSEKKPKPRTQWSRKWNEQHLDRLAISVPRGLRARIKDYAEKHGETVNGMIARLLRAEMGLSKEEWKEEERSE